MLVELLVDHARSWAQEWNGWGLVSGVEVSKDDIRVDRVVAKTEVGTDGIRVDRGVSMLFHGREVTGW